MTKWFNTNYHYIVPELNDVTPKLVENRPLTYFLEAKEKLGIIGKPVLIGPVTFVKLSKGYEENELSDWVEKFLPLYAQVLNELTEAGAEWIQIDEPILGTNISNQELELIEKKPIRPYVQKHPKQKYCYKHILKRFNIIKRSYSFPLMG